MATSIPINPDVSSLKKAFQEIRHEAQQTQAAISAGLDTGKAVDNLDRLQAAAASLKKTLEKVSDKTSIDIDVKGADAAITGLQKKVESLGGGKTNRKPQAVVDEEALHRLRKSHAQQEHHLKRKLQEQQARDADRAFKNYSRSHPHLRQFDSYGDFLTRGKEKYGKDFDGVRRDTLSYVHKRAGIGGNLSGFQMQRASRLAGAMGGLAGGMIGSAGTGGVMGTAGSMMGTGIGAAVGMLGGPLGMIGGALVGGLASSALGGIGSKLDEAMNESIAEGLKHSNLTRSFGETVAGFRDVRDAAREAAHGMGVTYGESADHAAMYARTAALRSPESMFDSLRDSYGFGRSLGVGQGAGVSFMASMRGTGAAADDKAARRIGLSVAEAIQRGGLGPQADEVLQSIQQFAQNASHANFRTPDVGAFASLMAAGNNLNLPGLHAGGMATILQNTDAAIRGGGRMGMASKIASYDAISRLNPAINSMEAERVMQGGVFGTIADAFGDQSAAMADAQARLKRANETGDKSGAAKASADIAHFRSLASGPGARVSMLNAQMQLFKGMRTDEAATAMSNHWGLTQDQSSALSAAVNNAGGVDGLEKRLRSAGIDTSKVNMGAAFQMASVAGGDRSSLNSLGQRLLEGKDFKTLDGGQQRALREAMKGGTDELRTVLLKILDKVGGPMSDSERAQQAQFDMRNAAVRIVDTLIPTTTEIKGGINALVEMLAPDTKYGQMLRMRERGGGGVYEGSGATGGWGDGGAAGDGRANAYSDPRSALYGKAPASSAKLLPKQSRARAQEALGYFMSQGWTKAQASGIVANLGAESKFDDKAVGDSGRAYGIAQWHPDRQRQFARFAGKSIRDSSYQEQLAFVQYELTKGDEQGAGTRLRGARTAGEAGSIVSQYYERPLHREAAAATRAKAANAIYASMTSVDAPSGVKSPDRVAAPEAPNANRAVNGVVKVETTVVVQDAHGRPKNDVKAESKSSYKPMPEGAW